MRAVQLSFGDSHRATRDLSLCTFNETLALFMYADRTFSTSEQKVPKQQQLKVMKKKLNDESQEK